MPLESSREKICPHKEADPVDMPSRPRQPTEPMVPRPNDLALLAGPAGRTSHLGKAVISPPSTACAGADSFVDYCIRVSSFQRMSSRKCSGRGIMGCPYQVEHISFFRLRP